MASICMQMPTSLSFRCIHTPQSFEARQTVLNLYEPSAQAGAWADNSIHAASSMHLLDEEVAQVNASQALLRG